MRVQRGLLLTYAGLVAALVGVTLLSPFIGDGFGFLALLLFFTAVPLLSLVVVGEALWRPNRRKVGAAAAALALGALGFVLDVGPAQAAGDWLFFRTRRGALDAFARGVLAERSGRAQGAAPAGAGADPCGADATREQVAALGFVMCRAEADRVALVAGGLLNREHGFVYVRPGSSLPARGEVTVGTRLSLGSALGGGWYTYAGR